MSDDKLDYLRKVPYRHGGHSGVANERTMLDRADGASSFKTSVRQSDDATVTMRTKDGMVQYLIEKDETTTDAPTAGVPYLESGQLIFSTPAPLAPDKDDPAKWEFLDIPTTADYLGRIKTTTGAQVVRQTLVNRQNSLAIGDGRVEGRDPPPNPPDIYNKKQCAFYYPPSIWSGRMRLFMQAQYGQVFANSRMDIAKDYKCHVKFFETSLGYVGWVFNPADESSDHLMLGWTAGGSVGIYKDSNYNYWIIKVLQHSSSYSFRAYRVYFTETGKSIRRALVKLTADSASARKLETYLLACAKVDPAYEELGEFPVSEYAIGEPMFYGWQFNATGSQARIVITKEYGYASNDAHFKSCTLTVNFTRTGSFWDRPSFSESAVREWTDGWPNYNLFAPVDKVSGPMALYSARIYKTHARPLFNFSGVEVYGFYDSSGAWVSVQISGEAEDTSSGVTASYGGGYQWSNVSATFDTTSMSPSIYLWRPDTDGGYWEALSRTSRKRMSISIGPVSVSGSIDSGTSKRYETSVGNIGSYCPGPSQMFHLAYSGNAASEIFGGVFPPNYDEADAYAPPFGFWTQGRGLGSFVTTSQLDGASYNKGHIWCLIIPQDDCASAYIGQVDWNQHLGGTLTTYESVNIITGFLCHDIYGGNPTIAHDTWFASAWQAPSTPCTYGSGGTLPGIVTSVTATTNSDPDALKMDRSTNTSLSMINSYGTYTCVVPASFGELFSILSSDPYYHHEVKTITSYDGRYYSSEGIKNPASVTNTAFIGWA